MRKVILFLVATAFVAMMSANTHARTAGFGFYMDTTEGSGTLTEDYDLYGEQPDVDVDVSSFGLGFSMDSGPLSESFFSNRLHIGYDNLVIEDQAGQELDLGGLLIDNTFCFGGLVHPNVKIWGGPAIRLGFYSGDMTNSVDPYLIDYEVSGVALGLGLAVGANFGIGDFLVLSPVLGWRTTAFSGSFDYTYFDGMTYEQAGGDLEGDWSVIYFSMDALFR